MMDFFTFFSIVVLGTISPGPDFAIVMQYSVSNSRRMALLASLGITVALMVHVLYCISGIALLLQASPSLFRGIQILGACYLGYLGFRLLRQSKRAIFSELISTRHQAFLSGFMTNLLNPKATLFILSLFSQFITPDTSLGMKITFGVSIPLIAFFWFSSLSFLLTHSFFLPYMQRYERHFSIAMGFLLVCLFLAIIASVIKSLIIIGV